MEDNKCLLCLQGPDDFGEFLRTETIKVHYKCMLLGPALCNKESEENNGLYGFFEQDVIKEEKRISKQKCFYCKKPHANLSCDIKRCKRSYHVSCALDNDCQFNMIKYRTFCHDHRKFEKPKNYYSNDVICTICCMEMGEYKYNKSIYADCCQKIWYHKSCVESMAEQAGYSHFKCPLCKNEKKFRKQAMEQGIFVPVRDAAWESEPNAFAEQLERPNTCQATNCLSSKGRSYVPLDAVEWKIIICHACGGKGIHQQCLGDLPYYICDDCSLIGAQDLLKDYLSVPMSESLEVEDNMTMSESLEVEEVDKTKEEDKICEEYGVRKCFVKLEDLSKIHLVQRRSQIYFSGKWIYISRLKGYQQLNMESITEENDIIPSQITTKESKSKIIRNPVAHCSNNKRKFDLESDFSPSKLLKVLEPQKESSAVSSSLQIEVNEKSTLVKFASSSSYIEISSSSTTPTIDLAYSSTTSLSSSNISFKASSSPVVARSSSLSENCSIENRVPGKLTKIHSLKSKVRAKEHRSPLKEKTLLKQLTLDSYFGRNINNNLGK